MMALPTLINVMQDATELEEPIEGIVLMDLWTAKDTTNQYVVTEEFLS